MYLGVALNFWYPLMTLLTASKKSFSVTVFLRARIAYMPASVQTLRMSAPKQQIITSVTYFGYSHDHEYRNMNPVCYSVLITFFLKNLFYINK
jgi:hypothetical protein